MTTGPKRKLVAIMFTDMVGYTSLMQSDEEKARNLVQKQRDLLKPLVEKHDGTVLQYVGDGTFCMFNSAIEAVNAAMEIQRSIASEKDLMLRIGIHIGDVVKDGDEIYGDGVNIASRLEPLAPPGGVCITGEVASSIRNQAGIKFESLGEKYLKNVDRPLEVFALTGKGLVVPESSEEKPQQPIETQPLSDSPISTTNIKNGKKRMYSIAGTFAAALIIWVVFRGFSDSGVTEVTADENSLAVLVIDNLSDPEDPKKLTEMIKELLITDLSQSKTLRVVGSQRLYDLAKQFGSSNGSLINRDNASKIAREARAQWMLTGKLTQLGEKMVLTTQIENVKDGKILDAQRADGTDLFDIIDRLSSEIRDDLGVFASVEELDSPIEEMTTNSPEAYKLYVDGLAAFRDNKFVETERYLTQAVDIDSTFSQALLYLSIAQGWTTSDPTYIKSKATANKLRRNSKGLSRTESYLGDGLYGIIYEDMEMALGASGKLIEESPDNKWGHYFRAEALFHDGDGDFIEVLEPLEKVLFLDPEFKMAYIHLFDVYRIEDLFDRGIVLANQYNQKFPNNFLGYRALGQFYDGKNEKTQARSNFEKAVDLNPDNITTGFNYLEILISESDIDAALSLLDKMEKNESYSSSFARIQNNYADVYTAMGQYENAYKAYEQASVYSISEWENGIILREEAELDILLGKVTTGIRNMSKSIGLLENRGWEFETLIEMNATLISHGEFEFALSLTDSMDSYLESAERKITQGFFKGFIQLKTGKTELAIRIADDLQNIILNEDRKIRNKFFLNLLNAKIYAIGGDYQKAIDEYKHIPEDNALKFKSELLRKLKRYEEALEVTEQMQTPGRFLYLTDFPLAYYHRGLIYEDMGNAELAIKNYDSLLDLWKDGDKKLPIRLDAQKRLSNLKKNM